MTTNPPWKWTEDDLLVLVRQGTSERLDLEYKRADALENTNKNKIEISKDVSAMANSAGGTIIYGVDEEKSTRTMQIGSGINPQSVPTEWLEQVIDSGIQRRIDGLRFNPIELTTTSPGRYAYVVYVPQSTRAPHMASDGRYYKRLGTITDRMEEYEVRDIGRRSESPYLQLAVKLSGLPTQPDPSLDMSILSVLVNITNTSPEPAHHAVGRLYVDQRLQWKLTTGGGFSIKDTTILTHGNTQLPMHTLHKLWTPPAPPPLLEGEEYTFGSFELVRSLEDLSDYLLKWELRAPKMSTTTGTAILRWGRGTIQIISP